MTVFEGYIHTIIYFISYYKKKYLEPKKAAFSNVVPTTDVQLNNKEMKDEDAKPLPPVAATKPYSKETSFSMYSHCYKNMYIFYF